MRSSFLRGSAHLFAVCLMSMICNHASGTTLTAWKQGGTPSLALCDMQGQARTLDDFRGKVVIVNFWATWCEPCVTEMPSLQVFWDRHAGEEIAIIGVNLGEGEARIRAFTERTGTTFPILLDRDGVAKKNWNIRGVPATFVLDGAGRIRYSHVGGLDFSDESIAAEIIHLLPRKSGKKKP